MYYFILGALYMVSVGTSNAEPTCRTPSEISAISKTQADLCIGLKYNLDDIKARSCAFQEQKETKIDVASKTRMVSRLKALDSSKDKAAGVWGPILEMFDHSIPKGTPERDKLYESLVDRALTYEAKYHCTGVDPVNSPANLMTPMVSVSRIPTNRDEQEALIKFAKTGQWSTILYHLGLDEKRAKESRDHSMEVILAARKRNGETAEDAANLLTTCEKTVPYIGENPWTNVKEMMPDCVLGVESAFASNIDHLDQSITDLAKGDSEFGACLQRAKKQGLRISKVEVQTSSDTREQTGDACRKYGPRGFLEFTEARANSIGGQARELIAFSGLQSSSGELKVDRNFKGSNGDGTSGPCAYTLNKDKWGSVVGVKLKDEYKNTQKASDQLKEYRSAKIFLRFEPKDTPLISKTYDYNAVFSCRRVSFRCRE